MRPLQPGDVCIVIGCPAGYTPKFVGLSVVLIEKMPAGTPYFDIDRGYSTKTGEDGWDCKLTDSATVLLCSERYLMRIGDDPDAEADKLKQQHPENAIQTC